MTVKAIYVDGVFKPQGPVGLDEHTEVEIEIKPSASSLQTGEDDPRSFVGFIKNAPKGVPLARDHDDHLDK